MKKSMALALLGLAIALSPVMRAAAEEAAVKGGVAPAAKATPSGKTMKAKKVKKGKAAKETKAPEKTVYICPMCHIKSDKPGKCPECGMDMVKETKEMKEKAGKDKKS